MSKEPDKYYHKEIERLLNDLGVITGSTWEIVNGDAGLCIVSSRDGVEIDSSPLLDEADSGSNLVKVWIKAYKKGYERGRQD